MLVNNKINSLLEEKYVIETVNQLFLSTDNRDWESVKKCFTEEVLLDITSMTGGEPSKITSQQIIDSWDEGLKVLKAIHHQTGNFQVSLNGDEADVFCYGIATHYFPNPTEQNTRIFVGSYNFHLKKINKLWKINMFKYNLKYIDGNLELHKHFQ